METYAQKLENIGVAASRISDIENAMDALHKALCKLDFGNLRKLTAGVGILGQLDLYARHNQVRNVAQDINSIAIHDAYRNIDLTEFPKFSDKLFFMAEEASEAGIPGATMLCKSLISMRRQYDGKTGLSWRHITERVFNNYTDYSDYPARCLDIRLTHKYVGSYKHNDEWFNIGDVQVLRIFERKADFEDGCDLYFVQVNTKCNDRGIRKALYDTFTSRGCSCEHDRCGCQSQYVTSTKCVNRSLNIWVIKTSWSINV